MGDPKTLILVVFVITGTVIAAMSVPLIRGRVRPNRVYGFRTWRTLANTNVWYAANRYAAWRLLWLGVMLVVVAVAAYFFVPLGFVAYVLTCAGALTVGIGIVLLLSFRYLRSFSPD